MEPILISRSYVAKIATPTNRCLQAAVWSCPALRNVASCHAPTNPYIRYICTRRMCRKLPVDLPDWREGRDNARTLAMSQGVEIKPILTIEDTIYCWQQIDLLDDAIHGTCARV